MIYKQLTCQQRYAIYSMKKNKFTQAEIAQIVGVHKSTISREFKRNNSQRGYRCKYAHNQALNRRKEKATCRILQSEWKLVEKLIKEDWSPEQISGRLKHKHGINISHEWIYQYILADKQSGGSLYAHLRCQKKRKKRYGSKDRRGSIKNRVSIDERPAIVDKRSRIGDWEGDTIIGKNHKQAIVTLAERKSRRVLIQKVDTKRAAEVSLAIKSLLSDYEEYLLTLTLDNGKEFAYHEELGKHLGADIYFAHPYSSYERGLNENSNGLIRQYFPKGSDFTNITENQIKTVENKLNNRPRKCLGFLTPNEVFFNQINVALET
jgi:IS30 family transposase